MKEQGCHIKELLRLKTRSKIIQPEALITHKKQIVTVKSWLHMLTVRKGSDVCAGKCFEPPSSVNNYAKENLMLEWYQKWGPHSMMTHLDTYRFSLSLYKLSNMVMDLWKYEQLSCGNLSWHFLCMAKKDYVKVNLDEEGAHLVHL